MQSQHPLTIAILLVCGLLALVVLWQVGRIIAGILRGLLDRQGRAASAAYATAIAAYERELAALPLESARAAAERVLTESQYLSHVAANDQAPPALVQELGPGLRALFQRYRRVATAAGQALDWAAVEPFKFAPQLIKIGDQDEHAHLCVRAGEELVGVVDDDAPGSQFAETFPSVYHWVLWAERSEELLRGGRAGVAA